MTSGSAVLIADPAKRRLGLVVSTSGWVNLGDEARSALKLSAVDSTCTSRRVAPEPAAIRLTRPEPAPLSAWLARLL